MRYLKKENGQAMVEFALVLPIMILILCGIIDFGWLFSNTIVVNNACREAARYTAVHYYDSTTDNDAAIARTIVVNYGTLPNPVVTLTPVGEQITLSVSSDISLLTPFFTGLFPGGVYRATSTCKMRIE